MSPEHDTVSSLTDAAILEFLIAHAADALELPPEEAQRITAETRLVDGLRLDSLRQAILVTGVEDHFGLEFGIEELAAVADGTVGDMVRLIQRKAASADTV